MKNIELLVTEISGKFSLFGIQEIDSEEENPPKITYLSDYNGNRNPKVIKRKVKEKITEKYNKINPALRAMYQDILKNIKNVEVVSLSYD